MPPNPSLARPLGALCQPVQTGPNRRPCQLSRSRMQHCRIRRRRRPVARALATEAALGDPQNAAFFFYRTSPRNRSNGFHPCHACKVCCNTPSTSSGAAALFQTQTGTGCSVSPPPPVTRLFIGAQNTLPNQRATYWCTSRQPQWNSLSSEEIGPRLGASLWTRPRGVQPPPLPQPPHLSPQLDSHLFARVTFCSHSTVSRRDC